MKRLLHVALPGLFIIDFIIDSVFAAYADNSWRYVSKGLLMPLLFAFFASGINIYSGTNNNAKYIRLIGFALLFSFLGDIFLIEDSSLNFMMGIAAFLIAHVFYIIFFCRIQPFKRKNSLSILISGFIILSYVVLIDYLFWPLITKQSLTMPVVTYSFFLGTMLFTAVNTINTEKKPKDFMVYLIAGAMLFVASDSILAFNKFYLTQQIPGFYVMLTYCIAQFLIVNSAIKFIKQPIS